MYNETRIVLKPNTNVSVKTATFEDAFGEYSSLKGRAARVQKRQEKKQAIQASRTATKIAKQENKAAVKTAKVEKKAAAKVAKVAKRADAQQARVAKRGAAQAGRGANKIARLTTATQAKQMRVDKRQISAPPQAQEEQFEEEYYDEPIEEGQEEVSEEEFEQPSEEVEYSEEDASEPAEEYYDDEMNYFDDIAEQEASFEGQNEMLLEPNLTYRYTDSDGNVVKALIDENVFDCAKKVQWNKEAVCRLENGLLNCKDESSAQKFRGDISRHKNRALQLEGELSNYCSADGNEDSLAIGKRVSEVAAAEREAKKSRMRARRDGAKVRSMKNDPRTFTQIEQDLDPRTTEGMIKIPAREIAADGIESNDNPSQTVFEDVNPDSKSCFDDSDSSFNAKGVMKKVSWVGVGAGVLLAAGVIYLVSKKSKV